MKKEKNPYANDNGEPLEGKFPEFMKWIKDEELARRKKLPKSEQEKLKKADQKFLDKMSDQDF